jgi:signal transduction histidine kinase
MKDNLKRIASVVEREMAEAETRRERRKAEKDLARAQVELRLMAHRLVELQEQERRHLARELHDEIGQSLTGLKLMMSQAARCNEGERQAIIKESQAAVTDLIRQVRELSLSLRPSMLDDLGLLPALLWHFERFTRQTRIKVKFEHAGLQQDFPLEISTAVYRIIQEALTNVARYARVDDADVKIWADTDLITVTIDDEGTGFNAEESLSKPSAGLSGMKERAQLLGGCVLVDSTPGEGTHVVAEIPLTKTQNSKLETHSQRI